MQQKSALIALTCELRLSVGSSTSPIYAIRLPREVQRDLLHY